MAEERDSFITWHHPAVDSNRNTESLKAQLKEQKASERTRAARQGRSYAEPIQLGAPIDAGAPLPHLISGAMSAALVFHCGLDDPNWDGTYTNVIDPSGQVERDLAIVVFERTVATLLGPPNDEAIAGHPLWGAGLEPYVAHVVHNSLWIAEYERRNRVHPHHSAERWNNLTHYIIPFHDETFEGIAQGHTAHRVRTDFHSALTQAMDAVI